MNRYTHYNLGEKIFNAIDVGIPQRNYMMKYNPDGIENQKRFFEELEIFDLFEKRVIIANSFGTSIVRIEDESFSGYKENASNCQGHEGVITAVPNLPLFVPFGDCPQLMIVGEKEIGLVHATSRTLNKGVLSKFFDKFTQENNFSEIRVAFSPYLHQEHFTHKIRLARALSWIESEILQRENEYHEDVKTRIVNELKIRGLREENILDLNIDTYELSKRSSEAGGYQTSHRQSTNKEGRSGLVLMIKDKF